MNIDVWFDVVCPFCYIGRRRLTQVLAATGQAIDVTVRHHAFQLSPEAPRQTDDDLNTLLSQRYGMSRAEAVEANRGVAGQARAFGLNFDFERARWANTRDAHRLIKLAALDGREEDMLEAMYSAFFVEGLRIGEPATLIELGSRAGLEASAVSALLSGNRFDAEIAQDRLDASQRGLRGVPFYVIGRERGGSEIITVENVSRLLRQETAA